MGLSIVKVFVEDLHLSKFYLTKRTIYLADPLFLLLFVLNQFLISHYDLTDVCLGNRYMKLFWNVFGC